MRSAMNSMICVIVLMAPSLYAGTPHTVCGRVFNSDGSVPIDSSVSFTAFIESRPKDPVTQDTTGCGYANGCWQVNVGNFSTDWGVGDALNVIFVSSQGEDGSTAHKLTVEDPEPVSDVILAPSQTTPTPVETPEATATSAMTPTMTVTPSPTNTPTETPTMPPEPTECPFILDVRVNFQPETASVPDGYNEDCGREYPEGSKADGNDLEYGWVVIDTFGSKASIPTVALMLLPRLEPDMIFAMHPGFTRGGEDRAVSKDGETTRQSVIYALLTPFRFAGSRNMQGAIQNRGRAK